MTKLLVSLLLKLQVLQVYLKDTEKLVYRNYSDWNFQNEQKLFKFYLLSQFYMSSLFYC